MLPCGGDASGLTACSEQVHSQGLWHRAVHVWLYQPDGRVVIQRRAQGPPSPETPHQDSAMGLAEVVSIASMGLRLQLKRWTMRMRC